MIITTTVIAIVLDSTLAITMVWYLRRQRNTLPRFDVYFYVEIQSLIHIATSRTKGVIGWLVMYYINTGFVLA